MTEDKEQLRHFLLRIDVHSKPRDYEYNMKKARRRRAIKPDTADQERYERERDRYIDIQLNQVEQFDKNMLLLSSGAFSVSFAFISQIVKTPVPDTSWKLIVAWSMMAACILNTMLSFLMSYFANDREVRIIDTERANIGLEPDSRQVVPKNRFKRIPTFMNLLGLSLFIIGIIYMLLYVASNMK